MFVLITISGCYIALQFLLIIEGILGGAAQDSYLINASYFYKTFNFEYKYCKLFSILFNIFLIGHNIGILIYGYYYYFSRKNKDEEDFYI